MFIALQLDERTRNNLARSAEQMKPFVAKGDFVLPNDYHITLHFLGEVAEHNLLFIQNAMDEIITLPAPTLALQQFTLLRGSGVVCAKLRKNDALTLLHEELGARLEKCGFNVEHRAYRPHVTVLRNFRLTLPFSEVTKNVDVFNAPFAATELTLYQSVITQSGVTYNELYRVTLN